MKRGQRAGCLLIVAVMIAAAVPSVAAADGDPASDVLLGQDVFLPYSPISQDVQRGLYAVTSAARQAGYPVNIALIGAKSDLGVVPSLFGKPARYAQLLSSELTSVTGEPVLVVMPAGFGLAVAGNARSASVLASLPIAPGADGLGQAAIAATRRLAAAAGHPVAEGAAQTPALGSSSATVRRALTAIFVLAGLAGVAIAGAGVARSRSHRSG